MNLLLCGNKKVFDGALTELISIANRTAEPIHCYIFTMNLTRVKPEYEPIEDNQIQILNQVLKNKNPNHQVKKIEITALYEKEFGQSKNENAYCTPYTLLRLLADKIPETPDKLLYLDIDMMAGGDIAKLYHMDIFSMEITPKHLQTPSSVVMPSTPNAISSSLIQKMYP